MATPKDEEAMAVGKKMKLTVALYYNVTLDMRETEKGYRVLDVMNCVYSAQVGDLRGVSEPSGIPFEAEETKFVVLNSHEVKDNN